MYTGAPDQPPTYITHINIPHHTKHAHVIHTQSHTKSHTQYRTYNTLDTHTATHTHHRTYNTVIGHTHTHTATHTQHRTSIDTLSLDLYTNTCTHTYFITGRTYTHGTYTLKAHYAHSLLHDIRTHSGTCTHI